MDLIVFGLVEGGLSVLDHLGIQHCGLKVRAARRRERRETGSLKESLRGRRAAVGGAAL